MNAFLARLIPVVILGFGLSLGAGAATCTAGLLDATFGPASTAGFVQVSPWLRGGNYFEGLAFGSDSRIYAASAVAQDSRANYSYVGVVRATKGGAIDRTYGGNGFVAPGGQFQPAQTLGPANVLGVDPSGRLVQAVFNNAGIAVSRFLADGRPDMAFGTNGVTQVDLPNEFWLLGTAIGSDASVFVGTSARNPAAPNQYQPVVFKLTPAGALDATFGSGGIAFVYPAGLPASTYMRAADLGLLPGGGVVLAGRMRQQDPATGQLYIQAFVAKLLPDGTADSTFGSGGFSTAGFGPSKHFYLRKLALQADGKIVTVGVVFPFDSDGTQPDWTATAARFNTNGSLDATFGSGGVSQFLAGYTLFASNLAIQNNGKVVISTYGNTDGTGVTPYTPMVRLTTSGQLDPAFGTNGIATLSPAGPTVDSPYLTLGNVRIAGNKIIASVGALVTNSSVDPFELVAAQFLVAVDTGTGAGCH